ncbi:toxin [Subtercola boreus]|uniref:Toxin n=1 Tax=Subtercola boreus TaxID=120213 RepID=A0A3E0VBP6_9MICO|nr:toxin [Subtercola boreus]RFA07181.1 toxin [Subtercola boreus]
MKVHHSALKHGIEPADSIAAATGGLFSIDLEEGNPSRQLRLGFDTTGQLLELVVLTFDNQRELIIHSMKARKAYYDLLD